jgi:hypothetical protein
MPLFRVLVSGHHFARDFDGRAGRYGFYTSCFVAAADARAACEEALLQVRTRPGLLDPARGDQEASIEVTDVLEWNDGIPGADRHGLVWYEEPPAD